MLFSVQTPAAGGTAFAQFAAAWCYDGNGYILNDTGTSLDVRIGASGSVQTLAAGGTLPIKLVHSMAELYVRRTDQSTTQVTVEAQVGTGSAGGGTSAEVGVIAGTAAAAAVAGLVGSTTNKTDFRLNLDHIPNFPTDGIAGDVDHASLRGLFLSQARSHFKAGRINHQAHFRDYLAQYSACFGWSCDAVDADNGGGVGDQTKGQFHAGYGNVGAGANAVSAGLYNFVGNTGIAFGLHNVLGGQRFTILAHTFPGVATLGNIVEVQGDRTAIFVAGKLIAVQLVASGQSTQVQVDMVVSSSYAAGTGRTSIVLVCPHDFQNADYTDSDGFDQVGFVSVLGTGGQNNVALGRRNVIEGSANYVIGDDCHGISPYGGLLTGRQAYGKNRLQRAWSTGLLAGNLAQENQWQLKATTTSATPVVATIDGGAANTYLNQIILGEGSALMVSAQVAAIRNNQNDAALFTIKAAVVCDGSGTLTILSQATTAEGSTAALNAATVVLQVGAGKALQPLCTGVAGANIRWVVTITATEAGTGVPTNQI